MAAAFRKWFGSSSAPKENAVAVCLGSFNLCRESLHSERGHASCPQSHDNELEASSFSTLSLPSSSAGKACHAQSSDLASSKPKSAKSHTNKLKAMIQHFKGGTTGCELDASEAFLHNFLAADLGFNKVTFVKGKQGDDSSPGQHLTKDRVIHKLTKFFKNTAASTVLLCYSGVSDEKGNWVFETQALPLSPSTNQPEHATVLSFRELSVLWQTYRKHSQHLVLILDCQGSGHWVEAARGLSKAEQLELSICVQASDSASGTPHACFVPGVFLRYFIMNSLERIDGRRSSGFEVWPQGMQPSAHSTWHTLSLVDFGVPLKLFQLSEPFSLEKRHANESQEESGSATQGSGEVGSRASGSDQLRWRLSAFPPTGLTSTQPLPDVAASTSFPPITMEGSEAQDGGAHSQELPDIDLTVAPSAQSDSAQVQWHTNRVKDEGQQQFARNSVSMSRSFTSATVAGGFHNELVSKLAYEHQQQQRRKRYEMDGDESLSRIFDEDHESEVCTPVLSPATSLCGTPTASVRRVSSVGGGGPAAGLQIQLPSASSMPRLNSEVLSNLMLPQSRLARVTTRTSEDAFYIHVGAGVRSNTGRPNSEDGDGITRIPFSGGTVDVASVGGSSTDPSIRRNSNSGHPSTDDGDGSAVQSPFAGGSPFASQLHLPTSDSPASSLLLRNVLTNRKSLGVIEIDSPVGSPMPPSRPGRLQMAGSESSSFVFNDDQERYAMLKELMKGAPPTFQPVSIDANSGSNDGVVVLLGAEEDAQAS